MLFLRKNHKFIQTGDEGERMQSPISLVVSNGPSAILSAFILKVQLSSGSPICGIQYKYSNIRGIWKRREFMTSVHLHTLSITIWFHYHYFINIITMNYVACSNFKNPTPSCKWPLVGQLAYVTGTCGTTTETGLKMKRSE